MGPVEYPYRHHQLKGTHVGEKKEIETVQQVLVGPPCRLNSKIAGKFRWGVAKLCEPHFVGAPYLTLSRISKFNGVGWTS